MNHLEINKVQAEYIREKDAKEFSLGDVLDVKTSVLLAVIVFLAAQSDQFFRANTSLGYWGLRIQYISVLALMLAGLFAILELIPREYFTEASPEKDEKWLRELISHFSNAPNADDLILSQVFQGRYERTKERVEGNIALNKRKSRLLGFCFAFTALSFIANLMTLTSRLF